MADLSWDSQEVKGHSPCRQCGNKDAVFIYEEQGMTRGYCNMCVDSFKVAWGIEYHEHDICRSLCYNFDAIVTQLRINGASKEQVDEMMSKRQSYVKVYMAKTYEEVNKHNGDITKVNMTFYWDAIKTKLYEIAGMKYEPVRMEAGK